MHRIRTRDLDMGLVMEIGLECAFLREASPEELPIPVSRRTRARRDSGGGKVDAKVMEDRARILIEEATHVEVPEPLNKLNVIRGRKYVYRPVLSIGMLPNPSTCLV